MKKSQAKIGWGGIEEFKPHWDEERARQYGKSMGHILGVTAIAIAVAVAGYLMGDVSGAGLSYVMESIGSKSIDGVGSVFKDNAHELIGEWPPSKKGNLAKKGDIEKIQSEYDYNYDGELDPLELAIAFETGARRSMLDNNYNNKIEPDEIFLYHNIVDSSPRRRDANKLILMYCYATKCNN